MSNKTTKIIEKFIKYGMDISSFKIENEIQKYELFHYIQIYITEILKTFSFTYIYEDNFYVFDDEGAILAFAITSKYDTILPVALTTERDELCFDIIKCFLIMIKDMRDMMPYVISDVMVNPMQILNKIEKASIYNKDDKKYDLIKLLKEMKKI